MGWTGEKDLVRWTGEYTTFELGRWITRTSQDDILFGEPGIETGGDLCGDEGRLCGWHEVGWLKAAAGSGPAARGDGLETLVWTLCRKRCSPLLCAGSVARLWYGHRAGEGIRVRIVGVDAGEAAGVGARVKSSIPRTGSVARVERDGVDGDDIGYCIERIAGDGGDRHRTGTARPDETLRFTEPPWLVIDKEVAAALLIGIETLRFRVMVPPAAGLP